MTQFPLRVTIVCPEALIPDANQLAMVYGYGPADAQTFGAATWQDTAGNLYAVASTVARDTFPATASAAPVRPAWDADSMIDMAAAKAAWGALVVYDPEAPVQADPARILAVIHDDAHEALALAGVERVPMEEPV